MGKERKPIREIDRAQYVDLKITLTVLGTLAFFAVVADQHDEHSGDPDRYKNASSYTATPTRTPRLERTLTPTPSVIRGK